MELGLLTAPFPDTPLDEVAAWSVSEGFTALEIACWPAAGGEARRYAGTSHIDVANLRGPQARERAAGLAEAGITISGLGYYPNPLHAEAAQREAALTHLGHVIDCASDMGVRVVNTFCGGDAALSLDENWARAREIWPETVAHAADKGVQLCFENCPMLFTRDEWPGGHNIAYSPAIWRRIVEEWDGKVGMNFDPSHLVWQMIDQNRMIREFADHIHHVHAKDVMIDREGLYDHGVMSVGIGWQVPRMPGLGEVDWPGFFATLYGIGYDGPVIVEHEDRVFEGTDEKIKRGFRLARGVLTPFLA